LEELTEDLYVEWSKKNYTTWITIISCF
jgi:hypothetical protein